MGVASVANKWMVMMSQVYVVILWSFFFCKCVVDAQQLQAGLKALWLELV